jgi:hypothetical protein
MIEDQDPDLDMHHCEKLGPDLSFFVILLSACFSM